MRRAATRFLLAAAFGLAAAPALASPPARSGLHVTRVTRQGSSLRVDFHFRNPTGAPLGDSFVRCRAFDANGNPVGAARVALGSGRAPGGQQDGTLLIPTRSGLPVTQTCTLERSAALPAAPAPPGGMDAEFGEDPPPGAWVAPSGGCAYDRYSRALVWSVPARSCLPVWPPSLRMN